MSIVFQLAFWQKIEQVEISVESLPTFANRFSTYFVEFSSVEAVLLTFFVKLINEFSSLIELALKLDVLSP